MDGQALEFFCLRTCLIINIDGSIPKLAKFSRLLVFSLLNVLWGIGQLNLFLEFIGDERLWGRPVK